jgi:hypothetical protein
MKAPEAACEICSDISRGSHKLLGLSVYLIRFAFSVHTIVTHPCFTLPTS